MAARLDSPPVSQILRTEFGAALTGEQVIRFISYPRVTGIEKLAKCEDPTTQVNPDGTRVNTFYPKGTVCYVDPSFGVFNLILFR